jgi:hypothetical protein
VEEHGGRLWVIYEALAYRSPEDHKPGHGTAWEPFPGPTSFTRDSELMNAETSAWGRACVAVGVPASKRIASREDVLARGNDEEPETVAAGARQSSPVHERLKRLLQLAAARGMKLPALAEVLAEMGLQEIELRPGWIEQLTDQQARDLGAWLELGLEPEEAGHVLGQAR